MHISTAAVYDRSPSAGDVDEASPLVGEDANDYAATKRDTDAALAQVDGITRVLVRPPAILGAGETSVWNTLRPAAIREEENARHALPQQTFPWIHVDDLAVFVADVATGVVPTSRDPEQGPIEGGCTAVNIAGEPAELRDYYETVTGALGVEPVWDDGSRVDRAVPGRSGPQVGLDPRSGARAGPDGDRQGPARIGSHGDAHRDAERAARAPRAGSGIDGVVVKGQLQAARRMTARTITSSTTPRT